jgi:aspartate/methionine/tyrosine aminotransferase
VVDEVFHAYAIPRSKTQPTFAGTADVLTFTLNGLSKCAGLPQLKLAWIVVSGPDAAVATALERLAFLADNYLSVGTPVQLALDGLLGGGSFVRSEIRKRCAVNLTTLSRAMIAAPEVSWTPPEGGWSAVVRFPNVIGEEELALELLREDGVAVHPGYFFDFPGEGYLTFSLLPPPDLFEEGLRRVLARIGRKLRA